MVTVGEATVEGEVGADNPVVGSQENVELPVGDAESVVDPPSQIVAEVGVRLREGAISVEIVIVPLSVQPFASVPVTV